MLHAPSKRLAFAAAFLCGAAAILAQPIARAVGVGGAAPAAYAPSTGQSTMTATRTLVPGLLVAGQIDPVQMVFAKRDGVRTVIDLRPDGEESSQTPSATMASTAAANGMAFRYVPVPQGDLLDEAADRLGEALAGAEGPVLLYCRSGRRAARAWALAEASRPGGLDAGAITRAVTEAGQAADDLAPRIAVRVAARTTASTR